MKKIKNPKSKFLQKYQDSGIVNKTGYTPGQPSFFNPVNIIPSNKITMENTPMQLLAISDKGEARILNPGEKHQFSGKSVMEIPVANFLYKDDPESQKLKNTYFDLVYGKNPQPNTTYSGTSNGDGDVQVSLEDGVLTAVGKRPLQSEYDQLSPVISGIQSGLIIDSLLKDKKMGKEFMNAYKNKLKDKKFVERINKKVKESDLLGNIFSVDTGSIEKFQGGGAVADPYLMAAQKIKGALDNVGTGVSTAGNILYQTANRPDDYSNLGQSAVGMGMQGAVMGAKFGGLPGAIIGGAGGAALGLYTAKKNNIEREEQDYMKEQAMMKNATFGVDRGYFQTGGIVKNNPVIPVAEIPLDTIPGFPKSMLDSLLTPKIPRGFPNSNKEAKIQNLPLKTKSLPGESPADAYKRQQRELFQNLQKFEEGGETKEKFESKETFYSQMIRDKNNYIIPQMVGQTSEKDGVPIVHIQAEVGEKAIMPDGSIFDVKADDKHEEMHKDYVTDVFPEGVYIAGARKSSNIKKKKAEKEVLGHTPLIYNEFEIGEEPEEVKLSDIFKKDVHTAAELADIVKNKFKISDREKDPFTTITNEENKVGRIPYLAKIIEMREKSKKRKPAEDTTPEMMNGGKVKKYQTSGSVYPSIFPTPGGGIGGGINIPFDNQIGGSPTSEPDEYATMIQDYQKRQGEFVDKYKQQYADYYKYARGANAAANLIGIAGTALQSSQINPAYKGTGYLDEAFAKTPQFLREQGVEQAQRPIYSVARNLAQLVPTSTVMSMMAPAISRSVDSANKTYQAYVMDDINQDRKKAMTLQGIQDYNVAQDANAENIRRRMDNYKLSQIAGYGGQALTGDASLKGRQVRDLLSLEGQGIQNEFSANAQLAMLKQQQRMLDSLNRNNPATNQSVIPKIDPFNPSNVGGAMQVKSPYNDDSKYGKWRESFKRDWGHYPEESEPPSQPKSPSVGSDNNSIRSTGTYPPFFPTPGGGIGGGIGIGGYGSLDSIRNRSIDGVKGAGNSYIPDPNTPTPSEVSPTPSSPNGDLTPIEPLKPKEAGVIKTGSTKIDASGLAWSNSAKDEMIERLFKAEKYGYYELENADGSKRKIKYKDRPFNVIIRDKNNDEVLVDRIDGMRYEYIDDKGDLWIIPEVDTNIDRSQKINVLDTFETEEDYAKYLRNKYGDEGLVNKGVDAYRLAKIARERKTGERIGSTGSSGSTNTTTSGEIEVPASSVPGGSWEGDMLKGTDGNTYRYDIETGKFYRVK